MHIERYNSTSAAEHVPPSLTSMPRRTAAYHRMLATRFSVDMYAERLAGAMAMRGFEIVTATADDLLFGIGHGVTLPRDVAWWQSIKDLQPNPSG